YFQAMRAQVFGHACHIGLFGILQRTHLTVWRDAGVPAGQLHVAREDIAELVVLPTARQDMATLTSCVKRNWVVCLTGHVLGVQGYPSILQQSIKNIGLDIGLLVQVTAHLTTSAAGIFVV